MKKRVLSLLLVLVMLFGMVPTSAFAEEVEGAQDNGIITEAISSESEETAPPSDDAAAADPDSTENENAQLPENDEEDEALVEEHSSAEEESEKQDAAVLSAQALIDALPDADEITEENIDSIAEQLTAIDEAMAELTDEQAALLDLTKYVSLLEVFDAGVSLLTEIENPVATVTTDGVTTEYADMRSAVDATVSGSVLKLLQDDSAGGSFTIKHSMTIDFNGYTWTPFYVDFQDVGTNITLKDSSAGNSGGFGVTTVYIRFGANVHFENGNHNCSIDMRANSVSAPTVVEVSGGYIKKLKPGSSDENAAIIRLSGACSFDSLGFSGRTKLVVAEGYALKVGSTYRYIDVLTGELTNPKVVGVPTIQPVTPEGQSLYVGDALSLSADFTAKNVDKAAVATAMTIVWNCDNAMGEEKPFNEGKVYQNSTLSAGSHTLYFKLKYEDTVLTSAPITVTVTSPWSVAPIDAQTVMYKDTFSVTVELTAAENFSQTAVEAATEIEWAVNGEKGARQPFAEGKTYINEGTLPLGENSLTYVLYYNDVSVSETTIAVTVNPALTPAPLQDAALHYGESVTLSADFAVAEGLDKALAAAETKIIWTLDGESTQPAAYTEGRSYKLPDTLSAGTYTISYTLVYSGISYSVEAANVTVSRFVPAVYDVQVLNPETINTATPLGGIQLSCFCAVPGTIAPDEGQTLLPGQNTLHWTFTPADGNKYSTVTGTVSLYVFEVLPAPQCTGWNGKEAGWSEVPHASGYRVQLYRDGAPYGEPVSLLNRLSHAFTFTEEGSYTYAVQALGTGMYADSDASEPSDSLELVQVSFDTAGYGTIPSQLLIQGQTAQKPEDPTGLAPFGGWYYWDTVWDFAAPVTESVTLTADWTTHSCTVTTDDGTQLPFYLLEDALEEAEKYTHPIIRLYSNIDTVGDFPVMDFPCTIDFNGHQWNIIGDVHLYIRADVVFMDSTEFKAGGITAEAGDITVQNGAVFTVNGGEYDVELNIDKNSAASPTTLSVQSGFFMKPVNISTGSVLTGIAVLNFNGYCEFSHLNCSMSTGLSIADGFILRNAQDEQVDISTLRIHSGAYWVDRKGIVEPVTPAAQTLTYGDSLNLTADFTIGGDTVTSLVKDQFDIEWFLVNGEVVQSRRTFSEGSTLTIEALDSGSYTFRFRLYDGDYYNPSDEISVTVNPKTIAPVITVEEGYIYQGSPVEAEVTVKNGTVPLAEDVDYTLEYRSNTHPGTGYVTVKPKTDGNYTFDAVERSFTIEKAYAFVTVNGASTLYTELAAAQTAAQTPGATTKVFGEIELDTAWSIPAGNTLDLTAADSIAFAANAPASIHGTLILPADYPLTVEILDSLQGEGAIRIDNTYYPLTKFTVQILDGETVCTRQQYANFPLTVEADTAHGQHAGEWIGDVDFTSTSEQQAAFIMPARDVRIRPVYESHRWQYTGIPESNNEGLRADSTCDCGLAEIVRIAPPSNLFYDGSAKSAVINSDPQTLYSGLKDLVFLYEKKLGEDQYSEPTAETPTEPGTYRASTGIDGVTAFVEYSILNIYTVELTAAEGIAGYTYRMDDGGEAVYTAPFTIGEGGRLEIHVRLDEGLSGYHVRWEDGSTDNPYVIDSVDGDMTLTPSIDAIYTVSFDLHGHGTAMEPMDVTYNTVLEQPEDPTEEGWMFDGWYLDAEYTKAWDASSSVIEDTTIHAKWQKAELVLTRDDGKAMTPADYSYARGVLTITGNGPYTLRMADGIESTAHRVVVTSKGALNLTLEGVHISNDHAPALLIESDAENGADNYYDLYLSGANSLTGGDASAGLQLIGHNGQVFRNSMLSIFGPGSLTANGGSGGAGIGGGYGGDGIGIGIIGGTVTANGGIGGAGIGGGNYGDGENIKLFGGTVTATGGNGACAIGSGANYSGTPSSTNGLYPQKGFKFTVLERPEYDGEQDTNISSWTDPQLTISFVSTAHEHELVHHDAQAATCTEPGWAEYDTCKLCDHTTYEAIEALGHDYADDFTVDTEPTCTEAGSKSRHCTRCDSTTDETTIPANGHSWDNGTVTTEATCTEAGVCTFHCTACEETKTETIEALGHDYATEFTVDTQPTCTEAGSKSKHCSRCDDKTEVTAIPAIGHNWDNGTVTTEATCTETGEMTFYCTACEETKTETIEALGHDYATEFTVDTEPTCTEAGSKSKHCSRCDDKTEVTVIPATGHNWDNGTVTTEATCTEAGEKTYHCTACEETKTEAIEALGHDYADEFTVDTEPTCTAEGSKSKHCSRCDDKTEATVIPATGHSWDEGDVTTEATCTEAGEMSFHCTACDATKTEIIKALGHDYADEFTVDTEPTCTEAGSKSKHCTRCDDKTEVTAIPAAGHSWDEGTVTTEATCTEAGEKTFTCTACDATKTETIEALGHDYADEFTVDTEPTCTEAGSKSRHCSRCDAKTEVTAIPATGHSWNEGTVTTEATCTEAGEMTFSCTACDATKTEAIEALGHDYSDDFTVDTEPTCTAEGSKSKHCTRCDDKRDVTVIPATGHSWDEGDVTTEATCTEAGEMTFHCTACDATKTETIEALGHNLVDDAEIPATCTEDGNEAGKHCTRCDYTEGGENIEALGHHYSINWSFDSSEHWHECSACNDKTDKAAHSYTDSGDISCNICGYERTLTYYTVSTTANPTVGGTVQGGGSYAKDVNVTVKATPSSGYHFVSWTENGQQVSTQATYSFLATANRTLVAVFEADAPVVKPVNIYGANVGLYNDIGMNFFVEKDKLDSTASYYAVITMGGSSVTILQSEWETQDNYFRFGFKGIAAKQMCDEVKVRIYFSDGTPAGDEWIDSLRAYAMRMLEKPTSSAKLKTTLVDMLNYGAAAQIQFNYNTSDLANKLLTAEQQSLATSTMPSVTNRLMKGTGYVGSSISLESNLLLSFYFENIDSSMSAKISYTDHYGHIQSYTISGSQFVANGGYYAVDVTMLAMADVNQLVNCKVYSGSTLVAEATDSIESYIARMSNKGEIYSSVMKFAVSARRYFDSIS